MRTSSSNEFSSPGSRKKFGDTENLQIGNGRNAASVLMLILAFSFMLEPKLFVKIPILNSIYVVGAVLVFFYALYRVLITNLSFSRPFIAIVLYRFALLFPTVMFGGELLDWGYYSLTLVSLAALFETAEDRNRLCLYIRAISYLLLLYVTANLFFVLVYPGGVIDNLFFLGIRTRFTEVVLVAFAANCYLDYIQNQTVSIRTCFVAVLGAAQLIIEEITTGLISIAVLGSCLVLLRVYKFRNISRVFKTIFVIGVIAAIAVCLFHAQHFLQFFIEDVLQKSATLSDREGIWDSAFLQFLERPIFGYGLVDNGNHILIAQAWGAETWQAHNNLLHIVLDGGLISFALYCIYIWTTGDGFRMREPVFPHPEVMLATWAAYNIVAITEVCVLQNYYFLFLIMSLAVARIGLRPDIHEHGE